MRGHVWRNISRVDDHLGILRHFIRVRDAGELFDFASTCEGVESFSISLLTHLDRSRNVNLDKAPNRRDQFANSTAGGSIRRNRGADRNAAVLGDFTCNITDASNIQIAMFFRKAQLTRQVLANNVTVEKTHRASAHFHELDHQCVRDR